MKFNAENWNVEMGGGLVWQAHHTWTDGRTDRVDGYLRFPDGTRKQLDVASLSDTCCVDKKPVCEAKKATLAWSAGSVFLADNDHHGVDTLVIGEEFISTGAVLEALARFRP